VVLNGFVDGEDECFSGHKCMVFAIFDSAWSALSDFEVMVAAPRH
jgi:hypothetical protein